MHFPPPEITKSYLTGCCACRTWTCKKAPLIIFYNWRHFFLLDLSPSCMWSKWIDSGVWSLPPTVNASNYSACRTGGFVWFKKICVSKGPKWLLNQERTSIIPQRHGVFLKTLLVAFIFPTIFTYFWDRFSSRLLPGGVVPDAQCLSFRIPASWQTRSRGDALAATTTSIGSPLLIADAGGRVLLEADATLPWGMGEFLPSGLEACRSWEPPSTS